MLLRRAMAAALAGALLFGQTAFAAREWFAGYEEELIPDVGSYAARGERLVYEAREGSRMILRDLRSGGEREIQAVAGGFTAPVIDGDLLAYRADTPEGRGIFLLNLVTDQKQFKVADPEFGPYLAQGRLVWGVKGFLNANADGTFTYDYAFKLEDLKTGEKKQIARIPAASLFGGHQVAFDGQFFAWAEPAAGGTTNLRAVDVNTSKLYTEKVESTAKVLEAEGGQIAYEQDQMGYPSVKIWRPTGTDPEGGLGSPVLQEIALHGDEIAFIAREDTGLWTVGHYSISGNIGGYYFKDDSLGQARLGDLTRTDRHLFYKVMGSLAIVELSPLQPETPAPEPAPAPAPEPAPAPAPEPAPAPAPEPTPAPQPESPASPTFYTVRPGDVLWRIAERFKLAIQELIRANNLLNPDRIDIGQELYLPAPHSPVTETYTVQRGDTLAAIAARYKTNVTNIQGLNRMERFTQTEIRPGQLLVVSRGPLPEGALISEYRFYAVMPGDTLWSIAYRSGTSIASLIKVNGWAYAYPPKAGDLIRIPNR